jgi:hypothetical protein
VQVLFAQETAIAHGQDAGIVESGLSRLSRLFFHDVTDPLLVRDGGVENQRIMKKMSFHISPILINDAGEDQITSGAEQ